MKREELFEKVKDIMEDKLGVDPEEVGETTKVVDDLGADSLDTVELIMEFEKEFGIIIPDEEAEKVTTVGEIVDGIQELMKK